jgi:hypothetical protein
MPELEIRDTDHDDVGRSLMGAVDELCDEGEVTGGIVVMWDSDGGLSFIMAGTFPSDCDDQPEVVASAIFAALAEELDPMEDDVRVRN